jgi:hypothetical protein
MGLLNIIEKSTAASVAQLGQGWMDGKNFVSRAQLVSG